MVGSALSLLRHDLRLLWRDAKGGLRRLGRKGLVILLVLLALVMHGAAWTAFRSILNARSGGDATILHGGALFVLMLLMAQSLNGITRALYGRGDLDLLTSSPLSARVILPVRAVAIACAAVASAAIFIVPIVDVAVLLGYGSWLALLPTLGAAALLATALAVMVAVALFALVGPRRARLFAQIIATFMGGGFMVLLQIDRMTQASAPSRWTAWMKPATAFLDWPLRAGFGEPLALVTWVGAAVLVFGIVAVLFGPLFLRQAMRAAATETAAVTQPRRRLGRDRVFRHGPGAVLRHKEWRIILRDPWIVSQILLQLLYIAPLFVVLWSRGSTTGSPALALASTVVVVSFQLAASLTWLGLSGEDAPELIETAPVSADHVRSAKIQSIFWLTAMVSGPLLVWLLWLSPVAMLVTTALACFAALAAIALNSWHTHPTKRRIFAARHRESKLLALIEMSMSMLFGIGAALAVSGSLWALAPIAIAAMILMANRAKEAAPA